MLFQELGRRFLSSSRGRGQGGIRYLGKLHIKYKITKVYSNGVKITNGKISTIFPDAHKRPNNKRRK